MSLFVEDDELIEIAIRYSEDDNSLTFYDKDIPEDAKEATFAFRRPNWSDQCLIMEGTLGMDSSGIPIVDPYRFMDTKFKVLLHKWSIKRKNGNMVPITEKNIDKLHPSLIEYLSAKLDKLLGFTEDTSGPLFDKALNNMKEGKQN